MTSSAKDRDTTRRDPETGGRPLADILREAGVESPTRGRRRRWDDTGDTGVRQRGSGGDREAETGRVSDTDRGSDTGRMGERPTFGRRASDRAGDAPPSAAAAAKRRRGPVEPSTAAIPGLRPSRKPGVPTAGPSGPAAATADGTGPIPVNRDDDAPLLEEETLAPKEGALAWLRFGGELVVALGAGVGIYFLFTVLWDLLPYAAVVLAPLAVAGLVAGVGAWRQRHDREPVTVRLVAVLVFAGTLLSIAPAAGLITSSG
ncbi:DUF5336 domain-containing protein [Geodermatophilus ruber]|uniref:Uncharacterized protein n=1 Tax=Geodermatophilus ruber TaxID=504800 RepID=A0A1I3YS28_9ACTN|nr:hypothetical protein [Geodermatophilus ruber]SFK34737.1 hypothetical protein SAMN04488085_101181 [Geodermatophilus ruber]